MIRLNCYILSRCISLSTQSSQLLKKPHVLNRLSVFLTLNSPVTTVTRDTMSPKPKVLVTRADLPQSALDILKDCDLDVWNEERFMPREVFLKKAAGKDGLLISPADKINDELLDAAGPQLKVIATHTVGFDHVNFEAMKKRGVRLGNTPGVLDDAVAELTIGVMLTCTRRLFEGRDLIIQGNWPSYIPLFWLNGLGLKNSVVGIVGMGRIGIEIARRLVPFKVKEILYTSRTEKEEAKEFNGKKVSLNDLLPASDIVIVMTVLCPETRHLIGEKELKLMKPTGILVNASRGDVLDQEALVKALKNGTIGGAALDVTSPEPLPADHELLKLKNCCIVPHLGSAVTATRIDMAELTARNLLAGLNGTSMPAEVV